MKELLLDIAETGCIALLITGALVLLGFVIVGLMQVWNPVFTGVLVIFLLLWALLYVSFKLPIK